MRLRKSGRKKKFWRCCALLQTRLIGECAYWALQGPPTRLYVHNLLRYLDQPDLLGRDTNILTFGKEILMICSHIFYHWGYETGNKEERKKKEKKEKKKGGTRGMFKKLGLLIHSMPMPCRYTLHSCISHWHRSVTSPLELKSEALSLFSVDRGFEIQIEVWSSIGVATPARNVIESTSPRHISQERKGEAGPKYSKHLSPMQMKL